MRVYNLLRWRNLGVYVQSMSRVHSPVSIILSDDRVCYELLSGKHSVEF